MAHHRIFREELAISYPTYGNALWEPDPGGQYNAVEVGDVGFIRTGYFNRLFNILHPKDHPSHRNSSFVPEDHQQLPTIQNHIIKNEIRTGSRQECIHFCSQYVTQESRGGGTSAFGPEDDSQVTFSCDGKQGALLSLPVSAQSEDTFAFGDFGKWMIKHIDAWFAFARGLGLGINRMEDIILVTGRHLTKSWVNVAFSQRRSDGGVSFDAHVSSQGHVSLERQYMRGGDLKLGPTGRDLPENQCIFLRGFRVVRILGIWPRLQGRAGPASNADDHEPEPESDTQLELVNVPADSNSQDPLHDLLQYIAKQAPDCDMAFVHDDDLACIDGVFLEALWADKLTELSPKSPPMIQQFQCVQLSGNKNGLGADAATAKVATLSKHAFGAPHGPSSPDMPDTSNPSPAVSQPQTPETSHPHVGRGIGGFGRHSTDPVRDLNNFLQGFRDAHGNLTRFFSWTMEGPDPQKAYRATAKLRGQVIGRGRGFSFGNAKLAAASQALQYLSSLPAKHPLFSAQQT